MGEAERRLKAEAAQRDAQQSARQAAQAQQAAQKQRALVAEVGPLVGTALKRLAAAGWPNARLLFKSKRRFGWNENAGWEVATETNSNYDPHSTSSSMWHQHHYYLLSDGSIVIYNRVTDRRGAAVTHGFNTVDINTASSSALEALKAGITEFLRHIEP